MKSLISIVLSVIITATAIIYPVNIYAAEDTNEDNSMTVADTLCLDENGHDYYRQFLRQNDTVLIELAENYLENKPQFWLTNAWTNFLNTDYKNINKNEYIFDMIIMGFLKFQSGNEIYQESLNDRQLSLYKSIYSVCGNEVKDMWHKNLKNSTTISPESMETFNNLGIAEDISLAIDVLDIAGSGFEIGMELLSSNTTILEANRNNIALFKASMGFVSDISGEDSYSKAMGTIIEAMEKADPEEYLTGKTITWSINTFIKLSETIVKKLNPVLDCVDLAASSIDMIFNSKDSAAYDIKLSYFYLMDKYLRSGLFAIRQQYTKNKSPSNARTFIDAFKTYLLFQVYENQYADEWLNNYIKTRNGSFLRPFYSKEIEQAELKKETLKEEKAQCEKMLRDIIALDKVEGTGEDDITDKESFNNNSNICDLYKGAISDLKDKYGESRVISNEETAITGLTGLCYLRLLDFNGDGTIELIALCGRENEDDFAITLNDYICYVYTVKDGQLVELFANDSATSGVGAGWESFTIKNSEKYGYLIESYAGQDMEDYTYLYGFTDNDFGLIASFESIGDEVDGEWITTQKMNGEVIYSGTDNPALSDTINDWLEHYAYEPDVPLKSYGEEIDTFQSEYFLTDTMAWLDNPDAFKALSALNKEYKSIGYVYDPEIDGTTIYADIKTLGYGNVSRVMSIDVDLTTNTVTEHDSNGYYGEYSYSLEDGRP